MSNPQEQHYLDLLKEYTGLTEKQLRARNATNTFGVDPGLQEIIETLDRERFDMHRELERLGQELGKSEHQVLQEITALLLTGGRESHIPGMMVVPVPLDKKVAELLIHSTPDFPKIRWAYKLNGREVYEQAGYLLIYNMRSEWGGYDRDSSGTISDQGFSLKHERITALVECLKREFPEGDFELTEWTIENDGIHHSYDDDSFSALFVDENSLDKALYKIQHEPEKYWVTEKEYTELCTKIVTESHAFMLPSMLEREVIDADKPLAIEIRDLFIKAYPDADLSPRDYEYHDSRDADKKEVLSIHTIEIKNLEGSVISKKQSVTFGSQDIRELNNAFLIELRDRLRKIAQEREVEMSEERVRTEAREREHKLLESEKQIDNKLDDLYNEQDDMEQGGSYRRSSRK